MKIEIACVGKLKLPYAKAGCEDYLARLKHAFPTTVHEVADARRNANGDPMVWKKTEGLALRQAIGPQAKIVLLDEHGRQGTSREFAQFIGKARDQGVSTLAFLIGGPDGLCPSLESEAYARWSLSPLTFPHELARLVLLEQLYRASQILSGTKYHRD